MTPNLTVVPTAEEAALSLDIARRKAAVGFNYMVELLTLRGFDPAVTTKNALDIAEHLYKVSGMAQKQAIQASLPTVKFTFNASPAAQGFAATQTTVEIDVTPPKDPLEDQPAYVSAYPTVGNFVTIEDED